MDIYHRLLFLRLRDKLSRVISIKRAFRMLLQPYYVQGFDMLSFLVAQYLFSGE